MDFTIRCNSLQCRTRLNDRAVVTTCSHIFCINCSNNLGLSQPSEGARVCPACDTKLSNPDDAVVTHLNPSEDYKTSILSGLSPNIIMECAGRGLSFYSYQTTQEILYQEYLAKSLTDKYANLSNEMDKVIHDANSEIVSLREKLSAVQLEQKNLEQRNEDLVQAFREKSRSQQQAQRLYQNLKTQVLASQVQLAASDDAEQTLHYATGNRPHDRFDPSGTSSFGRNSGRYSLDRTRFEHKGHPPQEYAGGSRGCNNTWDAHVRVPEPISTLKGLSPRDTQSRYRTRLPVPQNGMHSQAHYHDYMAKRTMTSRQPLRDLHPNRQTLHRNTYGNDSRK